MFLEFGQPLFDLFESDGDPEHSAQILHYRGCARVKGLQTVMKGSSFLFPDLMLGIHGGVVKQCLDCCAKGEMKERR